MKKFLDIDLYDFFIERLKKKENFSFARYGDGEWGLVLKAEPMYSNFEKKWGNDLLIAGDELRKILKDGPKYYIGIQPLAVRHWDKEIQEFFHHEVNLSNSDVFHKNSIYGNLDVFFSALKDRKIIVVGPAHLKNLEIFNFDFLEVPDLDAWTFVDDIVKDLSGIVKIEDQPVILYSCSAAANISIDRMYKLYGEKITQIDVGSLFDPYVGMNSRSYHKIILDRLKIPEHLITRPRKK